LIQGRLNKEMNKKQETYLVASWHAFLAVKNMKQRAYYDSNTSFFQSTEVLTTSIIAP
jgi:hypothetical protein